MRLRRISALVLAAAVATTMLTGCPWDKEEEPGSSSSSSSSSSSRPSYDDGDEDDEKPRRKQRPFEVVGGEIFGSAGVVGVERTLDVARENPERGYRAAQDCRKQNFTQKSPRRKARSRDDSLGFGIGPFQFTHTCSQGRV